jgi:hypothetical protein
VHHDRSAIPEKAFNLIQGPRGQRLKEAQAEGLRNRGINSIEDDVCARTLHPGGPGIGIKTMARFSELQARLPFGTLESPGKIEIGKRHRRVTVHRSKCLCNGGIRSVIEHKRLKGCARRFRPMYAWANMGTGSRFLGGFMTSSTAACP